MNKNKAAFLFAIGLSCGLGAFSAASYGADAPAKKPAATQPAHPDEHGKMDCCAGMMDHEHGMGGGMMGHEHGMGGGMMGDCGGGMMGGMMGGHGMMLESPRMHMVRALNLSDEQRAKINKLSDELQHKNWEREGMIRDEAAKLRDLYEADKRDPKAIGAEYQKIFDIKRQMIEAMVDTQNRVEALLTPEQLRQMKEMHNKMGEMHGHPMMH